MDKETEIKHLQALYAVVQAICGSPLRLIEAKTAANVPPTREEVEYLIKLAKNK